MHADWDNEQRWEDTKDARNNETSAKMGGEHEEAQEGDEEIGRLTIKQRKETKGVHR